MGFFIDLFLEELFLEFCPFFDFEKFQYFVTKKDELKHSLDLF